ncbi:MAG TPA: hypothetical protein VHS05_11915 [Pyrinomonadaceae bacterium]|jgi:hypothetical protein|nr:hypothetical protein [Pyrinomonadaceae bacterium]
MWIAAIRLKVLTKDARYAGTDDLVQAIFSRDDHVVTTFNLDKPGVDDHEPGDERRYVFSGASNLPRDTDQTVELQPGVREDPMPYPPFGFEFSNGLDDHLVIRLQVVGNDMWVKDRVDFDIKQIRLVNTASNTRDWGVDPSWSHVKTWNPDVRLSLDPREGLPFMDLHV